MLKLSTNEDSDLPKVMVSHEHYTSFRAERETRATADELTSSHSAYASVNVFEQNYPDTHLRNFVQYASRLMIASI